MLLRSSHADGRGEPHASPPFAAPPPPDDASGLSAVGSSAAAARMALGGHLPPPPPSSAHVSSLWNSAYGASARGMSSRNTNLPRGGPWRTGTAPGADEAPLRGTRTTLRADGRDEGLQRDARPDDVPPRGSSFEIPQTRAERGHQEPALARARGAVHEDARTFVPGCEGGEVRDERRVRGFALARRGAPRHSVDAKSIRRSVRTIRRFNKSRVRADVAGRAPFGVVPRQHAPQRRFPHAVRPPVIHEVRVERVRPLQLSATAFLVDAHSCTLAGRVKRSPSAPPSAPPRQPSAPPSAPSSRTPTRTPRRPRTPAASAPGPPPPPAVRTSLQDCSLGHADPLEELQVGGHGGDVHRRDVRRVRAGRDGDRDRSPPGDDLVEHDVRERRLARTPQRSEKLAVRDEELVGSSLERDLAAAARGTPARTRVAADPAGTGRRRRPR